MKTSVQKVWMVDEDGIKYSKEIEYFKSNYHQVIVNQQRDYDYTYSQEWMFDNIDDAVAKCKHIEEVWNDPPLSKYDSVYREQIWLPVSEGVVDEK